MVLIMSSSPSWAKWELLGSTAQFDEYVDLASRRANPSANAVDMWTMKDWRSQQSTKNGFKFLSEKVLERYDCGAGTSALIEIVKYSGKNGLGEKTWSVSAREHELVFDRVVPGGSGEVKWKVACNKK